MMQVGRVELYIRERIGEGMTRVERAKRACNDREAWAFLLCHPVHGELKDK